MTGFYRFMILALCALAAACAPVGPTLYGPMANDYGYRETPLETGAWKVSFIGNYQTDRKAIEDYALYRAAQLVAKQGFARFVVIDKIYEIDTVKTYAYRVPSGRYDDDTGYRRYLSRDETSRFTTTERRTATITIRPYRTPSDRPVVPVEEAARVIERLKPVAESGNADDRPDRSGR